MAYKRISFENAPKEMMEICKPLFDELENEKGAILFQIFKDGSGSGAFLPRKPYEEINAIIERCRVSNGG